MQIHDIEETGVEYDEQKAVVNAENEQNHFMQDREKRISIFSNMVNKLRRELSQGQLSFR
jgi:hypothetical protein